MAENTYKVISGLKEIIDENGPDYLKREPYKVYQKLIANNNVDKKTAGLILYALINDVQSMAGTDMDSAQFSKKIQMECSLNKNAADHLSMIFISLYSKENEEEWKEKALRGLKQFMEEKFICKWEGLAVRDEGNGIVDCYYEAEIILSPTKEVASESGLSELLKRNPFMTKEAISRHFEKSLRDYMDAEFEEYCTEDDYYQPVCEDFAVDRYASEWGKKNGFELISCDGIGGDGGYEPKFRKGWY